MEEKPPRIVFDPEAEEGKYCTSALVNFTAFEFIFDFGILIPGFKEANLEPTIRYHTRIRMSPQHAKAFLDVLQRRVTEYEQATNIKLESPKPSEGKKPYQ
jgi:hypothetical protein